MNFADRLISAVSEKKNPCVVGLDPRIELMPSFATSHCFKKPTAEAIRSTITSFHEVILDIVAPLVPAVKLQIAFYERYGLPGLHAFEETIQLAKDKNLIVIADAKRSDISFTAEAYADAFLGRTNIFGTPQSIFDVDCITVSPFLGRDSLVPFINACAKFGKGIFVLVKTSNPGSVDLQNQELKATGKPLYEEIARMVDEIGRDLIGERGYSSVGAVVGATFPEEARTLRGIMPQAIILVPGYGAQGGTAKDVADCFNKDGLGAVVNASRSLTYSYKDLSISEAQFTEIIHSNTVEMINNIKAALQEVSS